jgi:signal transduction histidine kinase
VDLPTLIQQCLTLIQPLLQAKKVHLINHLTNTCTVDVLVDSVRLKQVLLNLLSNAVKYNYEQGNIILTCEVFPSQKIRLNITDTGAGLSEEQLAKLFLPFERLNAKNSAIEGAGLGLCISKKLMEAMNGQIGVDSSLGEGCCFWIEIPIA